MMEPYKLVVPIKVAEENPAPAAMIHIHHDGGPGFDSSWLTNVDGMKDLWCSI